MRGECTEDNILYLSDRKEHMLIKFIVLYLTIMNKALNNDIIVIWLTEKGMINTKLVYDHTKI